MHSQKHDFLSNALWWVSSFVNRRSLKNPDQRPLYEYQVSNEEYLDLKRLLVSRGRHCDFAHDKAASACLVLFCAEWYRRDYVRDHGWSWDPLWCTLGFTLSAPALARVIPAGLEDYWGRPIRFYESHRRNFLGSVFSEGGLPFRVLQESDSRFQQLFSRVLKQHEMAQLSGQSTRQLVGYLLEHAGLPQVFSEETSLELIAQMADELISLVQLYDLAEAKAPLAALDEANSNWRNHFPIPLDEETGKDFLNGLLVTASKETKRSLTRDKGWQCNHFIFEQKPDELVTRISLPGEVGFHLSAEPASSRFDLVIIEGDQKIATLGAGFAVFENSHAKVKLVRRVIECRRAYPGKKLALAALSGGAEISRVPIEASAISASETPLVFALEDQRWMLIGTASCKVSNEDILLVTPVNSEVALVGGESHLSAPYLNSQSLRIAGKSTITVANEDVFVIRTGEVAAGNEALELHGTEFSWPTSPGTVFLGVPQVQWRNNDPESSAKGETLFLSGKKLSDCSLHDQFGRHSLIIRNRDNETLLRRRVGILPADFCVQIKGTGRSNQGSIFFYSNTPCLYQVETEGVESRQIQLDGGKELSLSCSGLPPSKVSIKVSPTLLSEPITIQLPFPSSGYLAFDAEEKQLPRELTLRDLLGARLYLYCCAGHTQTRYHMALSVRGADAHNAYIDWYVQVTDKPMEISLYSLKDQIENLLSLSSGIDQWAELRVDDAVVCRIGRYSMDLDYNRSRQMLSTSDRAFRSGELPVPVLMLLSEPERHVIALRSRTSEGVALGDFEIPENLENNGPWLVVPDKNSPVSFRPIFIPGNANSLGSSGSESLQEVRTLQKAVTAFDPKSPYNSFTPVLSAMALDAGHSGWQFLRILFDRYGYLPLPTFEVWKALVNHPPALAMAMFKFEMSAVF